MRIKFEPMPGKIVTKIRTEESRSGLILLSDPANSRLAEVIAIYEPFNLDIGKPDEFTEPYVQVGDLVVFGRHSGTEITVEREKVVVLKETEILTKIVVEDAQESS